MAGTGRQGLLQLSRRADQQSGAWYVPLLGHQTLATIAQAAQSERWNDLGEDQPVSQRLVPQTAHSSSMAGNTLRRHSPKVGAVCGKAACTVLCGGRSAMSVPTAIASLAMTGEGRCGYLPETSSSTSRSCSLPKNISLPTKKVGEPKAPRSTAACVFSISFALTSGFWARANSLAASRPEAANALIATSGSSIFFGSAHM